MDRRLTQATARVAHVSLRGRVAAPAYVEGQAMQVGVPLADLLASPNGPRDRQLWLGETFTVIDRDQGHAFGFAAKDGYCGWLSESALTIGIAPTHWVASPATHLYTAPKVQAPNPQALPMHARLTVTGQTGTWAETPLGLVPMAHLLPLGQRLTDPVAVAETFLHTPYLWGGNSRAGLDCSGLVQGAYLACGITLPADTDLIEPTLQAVNDPLQRGDLIFWKGHVALVVDDLRLIHANGHTMSVAYEDTAACIARIVRAEGLTPSSYRRP